MCCAPGNLHGIGGDIWFWLRSADPLGCHKSEGSRPSHRPACLGVVLAACLLLSLLLCCAVLCYAAVDVQVMLEMCPDCDVKKIPRSGPAPVLLRPHELALIGPDWERYTAWIEGNENAKKVLGEYTLLQCC